MFYRALPLSVSGNPATNTYAMPGGCNTSSEGTRVSFSPQELMLSTIYGIKQEVPNVDSKGVDLLKIF